MVGIIASNFVKIGNGWTIVIQYATTAVYVGTHFFLQLLENSRSHSNTYNLISYKKYAQVELAGIDDSRENMPGITNSHQNGHHYEKKEFREQCIKKEPESEK